jgi:ABC-type transporter Mla subunit MlaD
MAATGVIASLPQQSDEYERTSPRLAAVVAQLQRLLAEF